MGNVLIVDDEPHMRRVLRSNLVQDGHVASEAGSVQDAKKLIYANRYDVVITDQRMPDGDGLEVLGATRDADPAASVIFLTAFATVELAVQSMREGAFDFVTKPFVPEVVCATVRRACERTALMRENNLLKGAVTRLAGNSEIFGNSPAMQDVRARIARVAPTNATVLISGETGTGKELVAHAIHQNSARANKPFVAVNCAAFTETLLESELFGHERGAFTGADRARQGLFEAAHEGTLFLDEVGDMSLSAQSKLLRVLTDGQVIRLGTTRPRGVDVRVLAATHRDLQQHVRENLFREDLYYRLAVVPISLPPLRERREDIPGLCRLFLKQVTTELKIPAPAITEAAVEKLQAYDFPGNIRELRNMVERALILTTGGEIGAEDFPWPMWCRKAPCEDAPWIRALPEKVDLRECLYNVEKEMLRRALTVTNGAQASAGRMLGLSRSDMAYKLAKYGLKASAD